MLDDCGSLTVGQRADMLLLAHTDERQLGYEFGGNPIELVISAGRCVAETRLVDGL